jgi:hypothetical protein
MGRRIIRRNKYMNSTQTFSDLPKYEQLRAVGQATVQTGLFLIAVSSVLKHLGHLPDAPVSSTIFAPEATPQQPNTRGYFD